MCSACAVSVPRACSQSVIVGVVSCGRKMKVRRSVKFSCSKLCEVAVEIRWLSVARKNTKTLESFDTVSTL